MTLEEILGLPADELEKITDKQWLEFIEPYLKVTRPELAEKPKQNKSRPASARESLSEQKKKRAQGLLASLGIDLDGL